MTYYVIGVVKISKMENGFKKYMVEKYVNTFDVKTRLVQDVERSLAEIHAYPLSIRVDFRSGIFAPIRVALSFGYGHDGYELVYPKVKDFTKEDADKWFRDNGFTDGDHGWKLLY